MRRNRKLIITVILAVVTVAVSIGGVVLAADNDDKNVSAADVAENAEVESATCIIIADDVVEDNGCGSKYFPSE